MGNPFVHVELSTDDLAKAKKFYKGLFDWKLDDMNGGGPPYTMVFVGKGTGGGMQTKSPQAPTGWLPYVEVADVKQTLAKAVKAGGRVAFDYHPIGEYGAIGIFVDPTGATLGVWEVAKKAPKKAAAKKAAAKKPAGKKAAGKKAAGNKKR